MFGASRPGRQILVLAALLVLVLSGVLAVHPGLPAPVAGGPSAAPTAISAPLAGPSPSAHVSHPSAGAARSLPHPSALVQRVARQIAEGKLNGRDAFLPTAYDHAGAPPSGVVAPTPLVAPAPMGLADLGIGPSGAPYSYNTSSFQATLNLSSFSAYSPGYAEFNEAPNWATIQLNTVGVNISYPGSSTGTFWFQNVAHFNGTSLQFEDNIWNFSLGSALLFPSTLSFYSGTIELDEFYYDYGPTITITYPFTVTLSVALEDLAGEPAVLFNYTVAFHNGTGAQVLSGTYDTVLFNGSVVGTPQLSVNGRTYDPAGNEYDAEMILGGDGGGTNANLAALQGYATLDRWNSTAAKFESVPSAYDHGVDSGETTTGVATYYQGTTEHLSAGPSFLYGLWNTSSGPAGPAAAPGWIDVNITLTPDYGFLFATDNTSAARPLEYANFTYVPTSAAGVATIQLPPPPISDPYVFEAWADGYTNASIVVVNNATGSRTLSLVPSVGTLNAPIYLNGDGQVAALGAAGIASVGYAPTGPTLWINASQVAIAASFLRINDFYYPTFQLFAAENLNASVHVNGVVEAATVTSYTSSYSNTTFVQAGWTQGYYFFYGSGQFSVSNTTVTGDTSLYYNRSVASPGAVEFYRTTGATARSIVASADSFGVAVINSTGARLADLSSQKGANAISIINSTDTSATATLTNGTDADGFGSIGVYLLDASGVNLTGLTSANKSYGVLSQASSGLAASDLTAVSDGWALDLNDTSGIVVHHLSVNASNGITANASSNAAVHELNVTDLGYAGYWENGTNGLFDGVYINNSFGIDLFNDTTVALQNGYAIANSTLVDALAGCTGGTFTNITAVNGSFGIYVSAQDEGLTLSDFVAINGSLGANLYNVSQVSGAGLFAENLSSGYLWDVGANGSFANVSIGNTSLGVEVANATNYSVTNVSADQATSYLNVTYFLNAYSFLDQPCAPVALFNASRGNVTDVAAQNYPFTVWANFTNFSGIRDVRDWSGGIGIALNATNNTTLSRVFAYGDEYGAYLLNATNTTVTGSTFEGSLSYGVVLNNSTFVHFWDNNFVANNGAGTSGSFVTGHPQVKVILGVKDFFNGTGVGNYWSDHSGSGAYVIRTSPNTVQDTAPQGAFITTYLKFTEVGLPTGTVWGYLVVGTGYNVTYSASAALVYIPGWSLPNESYTFTVNPPANYTAYPETAPVAFAGANLTESIRFTEVYAVTFSESGLPPTKSWSVTLNGTTESATASAIVFAVPDGTYTYSLTVLPGWTESSVAFTGTVKVTGAAVDKSVVWVAKTYLVTFTAKGLGGARWSVILNGTLESSKRATITFNMTNGSYAYSVSNVSGFSGGPYTGSADVAGAEVNVTVVFSTPGSGGSSIPWVYVGAGGAAAVVALLAVALLLRRRRGSRTPPPTKPKKDDDLDF